MENELAHIRQRAVCCLEILESLIQEASRITGLPAEEVADFVTGFETLPHLLERLNER